MSQGGANTSSGSGANSVETLTGNTGGPVGADASFNISIVGNNTTGIDVVGTPAMNMLTIIGEQASTTQRGTVELATDAETIAYVSTSLAVTPSNLTAAFASPQPIGSTTPNSGSFTELDVDNIHLDGNTISTTDTNGNLLLAPDGAGAVALPLNQLYVGTVSPANPYEISIEGSVAGLVGQSIQNTLVNASAGVNLQLISEAGGGDAFVLSATNGGVTYSSGIDNSDSDAYKITTGSSPSAGSTAINISSAGTVTLPTAPLDVPSGGTGVTSNTAYAVLCGGTTATNPIQSIASVGSAGEVLTSNGAGALPTFQAASSPSLVLISTMEASNSATIDFTSLITSTYSTYFVSMCNVLPATDGAGLILRISINNGSTFIATGYQAGVNVNAFNSATLSNANTTTHIPLSSTIANDSNGLSGNIWMYNLQNSGIFYCRGDAQYADTAPQQVMATFGGAQGSSTVDAIRFLMSAGNITTGTFSLYGLREN